jgi:anthranilate phosphoribosyltransferase
MKGWLRSVEFSNRSSLSQAQQFALSEDVLSTFGCPFSACFKSLQAYLANLTFGFVFCCTQS